jgi:hypothetical protein
MKKTYLKPERTITVTSFKRLVLLAGSDPNQAPAVGIKSDESVDAGSVQSRQAFSVWDED